MNNWRSSWKKYSIGLLVVWAIVLFLVWKLDTTAQLQDVILIFCGYWVGWLSATIKLIVMNNKSKSS